MVHEDALNQEYIYRIDDDDNIVYVSENWSQFAADNDAHESCMPPFVLNKSIWDYIFDQETAHLYQILLDKVRKQKTAVNIPFRCDSPDCRRYMRITIKYLTDGHIEFVSKIIKIEWRAPQLLLDAHVARSGEVVRICSFCKKIAISENDWVETEQAVEKMGLFEKEKLPQLTHGLCPCCYESLMEKLE
jgi:hypothetical protein